jgi:hypothetical protein
MTNRGLSAPDATSTAGRQNPHRIFVARMRQQTCAAILRPAEVRQKCARRGQFRIEFAGNFSGHAANNRHDITSECCPELVLEIAIPDRNRLGYATSNARSRRQ